MSIVIDSHIPFLVESVRRAWPDVQICSLEPEQITSEAVRDAEVLVVRTRTRVDESLLAGSRVRLVCTATIGYDHIDTAWCEARGIQWMSCPGCNAHAVCDYIEEALIEMGNGKWKMDNYSTLGIVGVGHVGSLVAKMAERKGYKVLLNDPPRGIGETLDFIAQNSDIITFHVPLDESTYHLCDEAFLARCKPGAFIINAARGGVVDEQALLRSGHPYILDTWENEPHIHPEVAKHAFRASMHIAGYSVEGKRNASQMCLDAIAQHLGLPRIRIPVARDSQNDKTGNAAHEPWLEGVSTRLQASPSSFEALRRAYPLRA